MLRERSFLFWTYVFPILVVSTLGIAFTSKPSVRFVVDIQAEPNGQHLLQPLNSHPELSVALHDAASCRNRLRESVSDAFVVAHASGSVEYHFDEHSEKAMLAVQAVNQSIQAAAGRVDPIQTRYVATQQGMRYIDFLVPGVLGMHLLGGGLWGIGFVVVDMRIRKLLKLYAATPVRRWEFLTAIIISRLLFIFPQAILLILFSKLVFGLRLDGSVLASGLILTLGGIQFGAIGLLITSRAKTVDAASGIINLVSFPLWAFCGVFFSYQRFPEFFHPLIKILPLTPLLDSLRAVMMQGKSLVSQWPEILIILLWLMASLALASRRFRWSET